MDLACEIDRLRPYNLLLVQQSPNPYEETSDSFQVVAASYMDGGRKRKKVLQSAKAEGHHDFDEHVRALSVFFEVGPELVVMKKDREKQVACGAFRRGDTTYTVTFHRACPIPCAANETVITLLKCAIVSE